MSIGAGRTGVGGGVGGALTISSALALLTPLPVPVTVSVWVPVAVESRVLTLKVEVAEPLPERLTELGLRLPDELRGSPLSEREIVPE